MSTNLTTPFITDETVAMRLEQYVSFPHGLPGFAQLESFRLFKLEDSSDTPLFWEMQSLDDTTLSFILLPLPTGNIKVNASDFAAFSSEHGIDITTCQVYAITAFQKTANGKLSVQVNLRAPIVIDQLTGTGWQVILSPHYPLAQTIVELD